VKTAINDEPMKKCEECGSTQQPIFLYPDGVYRCLECATRYLSDFSKEAKDGRSG